MQSSLVNRDVLCGVLLVVLTLGAYVPAFSGDFFWDDESYLVENSVLRVPGGLTRIRLDPAASPQYYPLVFTTFWAESRLWGLEPRGYHAVNILLHAFNVVLLWTVLLRLAVPGALLAACVFAVHPVHVESVAWITERKDMLSTLFYLAAVLCWLGYLRSARTRSYLLVLGFFIGAMLSKTMACTLPITLALLTWWQHPQHWRRFLVALVPLLLVSVVLGSVTLWRENQATYADIVVDPLSLIDRVLLVGRAFWFYLGKLLWPVDLMPIYPRWEVDAGSVQQYLYPVAAAALLAGAWVARRRFGDGLFVALSFFVITLAPVLGFIPFTFQRLSFVADHFQYLASAAPIAALAAAVALAAGRFQRSLLWIAGGVIVLALSILTWRQASLYGDSLDVWRANLDKNPTSASVLSNLGSLLQRRGDDGGALRHLTEAVRLHPQHLQARYNLATVLAKSGDVAAATAEFEAALQIKPDYAPAHYGLGTTLMRPPTTHQAAEHLEQALRTRPDYPEAHYNLGIVRSVQGDFETARQHFAAAVALKPDYIEAHNNLGATLFRLGDIDGAVVHYRAAIRLNPGHTRAHYNLGLVLARQGKPEEALQELRAAVGIDPQYADAHRDLAALLEMMGRRDEALAEYTEAARLQPLDPRAREGLQRLSAGR